MLHDIQINPADGSLWIADSRNNRVRAIRRSQRPRHRSAHRW